MKSVQPARLYDADLDELQLFTDAFPFGIITVNSTGTVNFANLFARQTCFETAGLKQSLIHRSSPEQSLNLVAEVHTVISDSISYNRTITRQMIRNKRVYLIESHPVCGEDGIYRGSVFSVSDITRAALSQKQNELLYQISSLLSRVGEIESSLKDALRRIVESLSVKAANIMIVDQKNSLLQVKVDSYPDVLALPARKIKIGEGVAGHCALEKTPYSVYDVAASELFSQKTNSDTGALLSVPLISKGELVGV